MCLQKNRGCSYLYLSRQSDRKTDAVAVGAERPGGGGRGASALCPGAGLLGLPAAAGADGALRLSQHPYGGCQHPGLPAKRCVLFAFISAVLRVEGAVK